MPLSTWRKWWRRVSTPRNTPGKKKYFRKCFLEILEDRVLLSNTYVVDLAGDAGAADPTNPLAGVIRYCINQADQKANAGSTITFDPTFVKGNKTITLSNGELEIAQSTTITGPGAGSLTISGGNNSRVFNITSQFAVVTIAGLTIANGNASPAVIGSPGNQGGDIFNGGKTLTLTGDIVKDGVAQGNSVGPQGRGGGIFNALGATLALNNTTVQKNMAVGIDGTLTTAGGLGAGGGIYNDTSATLILNAGSQVVANKALGGNGYNGLDGFNGVPSQGFNGGAGGAGQPGGTATGRQNGTAGGAAEGGGIYNDGTLTIAGTSTQPVQISQNLAQGGLGGNGGAGGNGGNGGNGSAGVNGVNGGPGQDGGSGGAGGAGGKGGDAAAGGSAQGGGLFSDKSGTLTGITQATFSKNNAVGGAGGNGGKGGTGGNAGNGNNGGNGGFDSFGFENGGGDGGDARDSGSAEGGAVFNQGGDVTIASSTFTSNQATSSMGGTGGAGDAVGNPGGNGGDALFARGGAISDTAGNLTVSATTFGGSSAGNLVTGGAGGAGGSFGGIGGNGAPAYGGAISASDKVGNVTLNGTAANPITFANNAIQSGDGDGSGGSGVAYGGGLSYHLAADDSNTATKAVTVGFVTFSNNTVVTGTGVNAGSVTADAGGTVTFASNAFTGGRGGGLAFVNEVGATNLTVTSSSFTANQVTGGSGGNGSAAASTSRPLRRGTRR